MPKVPEPSTLNTFPTFINRKLHALNSEPEECDLDAIRDLLDVVQEDRVVTDEEVQEWKRTEKKVLENQNAYKEKTKNTGMIFLPEFLCFILFVKFCFKISQFILEVEFPKNWSYLVWCWPIDFILVASYLIFCSDLRLNVLPAKPVEPVDYEVEDDDWQYSMTSKELLSRQKALVNGWTQLGKERIEHRNPDFWCTISRHVNMVYFLIRFVAILHHTTREDSRFYSCLTQSERFFVNVESFSSYLIFGLFFVEFIREKGWLRAAIEFHTKHDPVCALFHEHPRTSQNTIP